jgi:hypothetical protein
MRYDPAPSKPSHVIAAAVWKYDRARKRYRLQQVCYEPRKRRERAEPEPPSVKRRQGLLL